MTIRERDDTQARLIDAALIHADLMRERDEARAEVERLRTDRDKWRDRYHAMRTDVGLSGDIEDEIAAAYRSGAEAMREACQQWCRAWENDGEAIADALADLRVEDKP